MKKIVFMALVAIFTLSFALEAQDNGRNRGDNPGMRQSAKERADTMEKQLGLTADVKAKVVALLEKQDKKQAEEFAKMRENRDNQTQDREKRRAEMQAAREKRTAENDAELEKIIGKEKMEQWKKYRAEQQQQMRNERPARQGGGSR